MIQDTIVRSFSFWLIGVLSCICKLDPIVMPKIIPFLLCLFPLFVSLLDLFKTSSLKNIFFLKWYGLFFALVLISLLYTANQIDPEVVIRRCSLCFVLGFSLSQLCRSFSEIKKVLLGVVHGAFFTEVMTFSVEFSSIGSSRMGGVTCGAGTCYAGILLVGLFCVLLLSEFEYRKSYVVFGILFFVGIVLSGSRMPLIFSVLGFFAIKVLQGQIKINSVLYMFVFVGVFVAVIYVLMHVPFFVNIIGERIGSMIESFLYGVDSSVDLSLKYREQMKMEALKLWQTSPFWGRGVNSFWVLSPITNGRAPSHCGFTEILCSFGCLGFILFYWPFIKNLKSLLHFNLNLETKMKIILLFLLVMEWQGGYFESSVHIVFCLSLFLYIKFLQIMNSKKLEPKKCLSSI